MAKSEKPAKVDKTKKVTAEKPAAKAEEPLPKLNPEKSKSPTVVAPARGPWLGLGVGGTILGLAMIGGGIPLVVIDGQPSCGHSNCTEVWDTAKEGGPLIGLGAVSLVASGVFYYMDYRTRKANLPHAMVLPLSGGAMLSLGGQF